MAEQGQQQLQGEANSKERFAPVPVIIQTRDAEVQGLVYVERSTREERKLSELLNDPNRRFVAVTDAQVTPRAGVSTPFEYDFLMLHVDNIVMVHPVLPRSARNAEQTASAERSLEKLKAFRQRLSSANDQAILRQRLQASQQAELASRPPEDGPTHSSKVL